MLPHIVQFYFVVLAIFLVVIGATLVLLFYLAGLDRYKRDKQTHRMVLVGVGAGVLSFWTSLGFYFINPFGAIAPYLGELGYHFLVVGLSEETAKYASFIAMVLIFRSIKEPQDGIIQGAAVGLGFQAAEDIMYGLNWGLEVAILRTAYLGLHMLCGALWGYAFASAFYANLEAPDRRSVAYALLAVIPVALFHGLYNTLIGVGSVTGRGPAMETVIALVMLIISVKAFRAMVARSPYRRYPYHRFAEAIPNIRRGLLLNPTSVILNRRMALYHIAGGRYMGSLKYLRVCKRHVKKQTMYEALEAIAMVGAGAARAAQADGAGSPASAKQAAAEGERRLAAARKRLDQEGRTMELANQLHRFVRDEALLERVQRVLLPAGNRPK